MTDPRHALGLRIEEAAADWLARAGWSVVARRARSAGGGEVDILGVDPEGVLVAVEVRARRSDRTGPAVTSVDIRRVARLRRTLGAFATSTQVPHRGLRIDLVAAEPMPGSEGSWRLTRVPGIDAG